MRLLIPCMTCQFSSSAPFMRLTTVEFRDDGRYDLECPAGHKTSTFVQEAKYEILFEIGVNAIADGYYREAVTSFAACLERFYEFAVAVLLEVASVERDKVLAGWKPLSGSSERQLGAFAMLWLRQFGEVANALSSKRVEFRNEVVHKGVIPTRAKAIDFGDAVLAVILPKLARLRGDFPEQVHKLIFYSLRERSDLQKVEVSGQPQASTMSIRTIFNRGASPSGAAAPTVATYLTTVLSARAVMAELGSVVTPAAHTGGPNTV